MTSAAPSGAARTGLTGDRRRNLERLFAPRHVAFIGGNEAAEAARQCQKIGFDGPMWAVNPKRRELAGLPCYPSVQDLPEAPDAVFLAVPAPLTVRTLGELAGRGAGGVVCYAAGFKEMGAEGLALERALIEAAGSMAIVGPNCYGVINYVKGVALWPYGQPGSRTERGPAVITQSGMFAINLTFNDRSAAFSHVISSGNQSVLGIEDYIEFLLEDPSVSAVGLHIEMLRDIPRFARVAIRAAAKGIPIVAFKTGASAIGARLTVSHTGSLAGSDEAYNALFHRLAITRVDTPAQLLETLKMFTHGGIPAGRRLGAFTCSGGDAEMVADWAERYGLELPQPGAPARERLVAQLGSFANVSNPLDYNTAIWGHEDKVEAAHSTFLADGYDATVLIQDFPPLGSDIDRISNTADTRGFLAAARKAKIPAAVCSTLPECLTQDIRDLALASGAAPLQGIRDGLFAFAAAATYGARRERLRAGDAEDRYRLAEPRAIAGSARVLDEWESKRLVAGAGVPVPAGRLCRESEAIAAAEAIGFPVAIKLVSAALPHKTEAGAVRLGLASAAAVAEAVAAIKSSARQHVEGPLPDRFLVERMAAKPVAEMMVGIRRDESFGYVLLVGAGGTGVELARDVATLLLPLTRPDLMEAIAGLKIARILEGYRGGPAGDVEAFGDAVLKLAGLALEKDRSLLEIELNPVMVLPRGRGVVAVDALARSADVAGTTG
ncbi:MAG TPA: acetate--CoA ligase family protein [Hypericibacter adhaerens]|uniref:acetate--CoA ligase family protein n=1 Tax=Hypericibacter adhaerens TaxID=2602016 RepID=UPI002C80BFB6|nr:acetate--CoA ligase family protein [Hypericibacter adhaerens]HWA45817.1 acetate--CoA ligase family protein [Hypericibacter adhaerens]